MERETNFPGPEYKFKFGREEGEEDDDEDDDKMEVESISAGVGFGIGSVKGVEFGLVMDDIAVEIGMNGSKSERIN
jgi:hypothetical protein